MALNIVASPLLGKDNYFCQKSVLDYNPIFNQIQSILLRGVKNNSVLFSAAVVFERAQKSTLFSVILVDFRHFTIVASILQPTNEVSMFRWLFKPLDNKNAA